MKVRAAAAAEVRPAAPGQRRIIDRPILLLGFGVLPKGNSAFQKCLVP